MPYYVRVKDSVQSIHALIVYVFYTSNRFQLEQSLISSLSLMRGEGGDLVLNVQSWIE